jgi:hypothetical protein
MTTPQLTDAGLGYAMVHHQDSIVCRVALTRERGCEADHGWPVEFVDAAVKVCNAMAIGESPGGIVIHLPWDA